MLCYKRRKDIERVLKIVKGEGKKVGFLPTMGALHDGHVSLLRQSKRAGEITVCSIFVNPTQFNQQEDFVKYPITTASDLLILSQNDCDIVFLPEVSEIYPNGTTTKTLNLGKITTILEGAHRLGHFDGVAQVVGILLDIISPHHLYMGQKDFQQVMVVQKLIEVKPYKTRLVICPTQREKDGLAMSSRNVRLTPENRIHALSLSKVLFYIKENYRNLSNEKLVELSYELLSKTPEIKIEYLNIVSKYSLEPIETGNQSEPAIALLAAWVGNVRLIDNILL